MPRGAHARNGQRELRGSSPLLFLFMTMNWKRGCSFLHTPAEARATGVGLHEPNWKELPGPGATAY